MEQSSRPHGQAMPTGRDDGPSSWRWTVMVFLLCFSAYTINGDLLVGGDQESSMLFSVNLLTHHSPSIAPPHAPGVFSWTLERSPGDTVPIDITHWNNEREVLYRQGQLRPGLPYFMVPTVWPGQTASTFGIGPALTALPVYAALNLVTDITSNRLAWWYGAKVTASLLTAGAAMFIFLAMRRFVPPLPAALGALAFGLGSCAWSLSSQALWQQTPYLFFLSLGAWWLVGVEAQPRSALYCGAAFGMAALCRPTGVIPVVLVGLYLLWLSLPFPRLRHVPGAASGGEGGKTDESAGRPTQPSALPMWLAYVLGGLPFAILLGTYNAYYFGSPFVFAQEIVGGFIAQQKGFASVWQTPLAEGLAGLLFSPSRGLFVYSPIMVFGVAGAVMTWRDPRNYAPLIPLQVAVLVQFAVAAKWFDWWGGWTYGPRPIVDTGVFLALLMSPVIARVTFTPWMRGVFMALLLYSVTVQVIGAWSFNLFDWNTKNGMDIDKREHQSRLWSFSDSQIVYYATHFQSARDKKQTIMKQYLHNTTPIVISRTPGDPSP